MKRIILTGGGTAGHVTPNLALIPELKREGWEIHYIGTADGIDRVEVRWPSGELQTVNEVDVDQLLTIEEPTIEDALADP